jgi:hypothetical protein
VPWILRHLIAVVVLPFSVAVLMPWWLTRRSGAQSFGGRADGSRFFPALNLGTCGCFGLRTSGAAGSWICFVSLPRGRLLMVFSLVRSLPDANGTA